MSVGKPVYPCGADFLSFDAVHPDADTSSGLVRLPTPIEVARFALKEVSGVQIGVRREIAVRLLDAYIRDLSIYREQLEHGSVDHTIQRFVVVESTLPSQ